MRKRYIVLGLLMSVMLMGCSQNDSNVDAGNASDTKETKIVYKQSTSNKQTDSKTKEKIEVMVDNEISLYSTENEVIKMTVISKGNYSNASDEHFDKVMDSIKESSAEEIKGLEFKYKEDGKTNIVESTYNLKEFSDDMEKNRLYISCGLDPEKYNENGTYPLDDLVKTLEEMGYTK